MQVVLSKVRVAFPQLFEAKSINDGEPQFSAIYLIEPGSANAKALEAAVAQVAKEKWAGKADAILKTLRSRDRVCYRTEPKVSSAGVTYAGFEGTHHVSASNKARVEIVDRNPKVPLVQADGRPYAGCYVNTQIDIWAMDNQYGQRICASLGPVQFVADGDAFGASTVKATAVFANLEEGATADDLM